MSEPESVQADQDRYQGRPLLLILDNYVLDCIGHLSEEFCAGMAKVVSHVFEGSDDWKATVRRELRFEDAMDAHLLELWERNQELAREHGEHLAPLDFARAVVDKNFAPMIDPIA